MYKWNAAEKRFSKHLLADNGLASACRSGSPTSMATAGRTIIVAGKSGTHILWNNGK